MISSVGQGAAVQRPQGLRRPTAAPRASVAAGSRLGGIAPAGAAGPPRGSAPQEQPGHPEKGPFPGGVPRESLMSPVGRTGVTSRCHRHRVRG